MKLKTALLGATLSLGSTLGLSAQAEEIICETKEICQKLSQSIQAQINKLEVKGLGNLSDEEFDQFANLKKQLIALKKSETIHNERSHQKQAQQQEVMRKSENERMIGL